MVAESCIFSSSQGGVVLAKLCFPRAPKILPLYPGRGKGRAKSGLTGVQSGVLWRAVQKGGFVSQVSCPVSSVSEISEKKARFPNKAKSAEKKCPKAPVYVCFAGSPANCWVCRPGRFLSGSTFICPFTLKCAAQRSTFPHGSLEGCHRRRCLQRGFVHAETLSINKSKQ